METKNGRAYNDSHYGKEKKINRREKKLYKIKKYTIFPWGAMMRMRRIMEVPCRFHCVSVMVFYLSEHAWDRSVNPHDA